MTRRLLHHSRAWIQRAKYARTRLVTTVDGRGQSRDVERLRACDVQRETTEWRSIG